MATAAELVSNYIRYRDFCKQKQDELDAALKPYKEAMDTIGTAMLNHLNTQGIDNLKTDAGTAYTSDHDSMTVSDREAFMDFILESGETQLLTAAVAKDAVRAYMEEHQGQLPPGVSANTFRKINFRRA